MIREPNAESRGRLRRALVEAVRQEQMPASLEASLMAIASGDSLAHDASGGATSTASANAVGPAASAGGSSAGAGTGLVVWKWIAGASLLAVVVGASSITVVRWERDPSGKVPASVTSAMPAAATASVEAMQQAPLENRPLSVDALPNAAPLETANDAAGRKPARAKHGEVVGSPAAPTEATMSAERLAEEMKLVERIRAAGNGGRPADALRLVDEHREAFPTGALVEETEVLRIESLARLGREQMASTLVRRFLQTHPTSFYRARVEAVANRITTPTTDHGATP